MRFAATPLSADPVRPFPNCLAQILVNPYPVRTFNDILQWNFNFVISGVQSSAPNTIGRENKHLHIRDSILRLQHCFLIDELLLGLESLCLLLRSCSLRSPVGVDPAGALYGVEKEEDLVQRLKADVLLLSLLLTAITTASNHY